MDIKRLIDEYNTCSDDRRLNEIHKTITDYYKAYLDNIKYVVPRRQALSLNVITRKNSIADYIKSSDNILFLIDSLAVSDDPKTRKNIYGVYYNLGIHIDKFYDYLISDDVNYNKLAIVEYILKSKDSKTDITRLESIINSTVDRNDVYYKKISDVLRRQHSDVSVPYAVIDYNGKYLFLSCSKFGLDVLIDDCKTEGIKVCNILHDGIIVKCEKNYDRIKSLRSYYEIMLADFSTIGVSGDSSCIAECIKRLMAEYCPDTKGLGIRYRLELKTSGDNKNRIATIKAILGKLGDYSLYNSRNDYTVEIRIYKDKNKNGEDIANIFIITDFFDNRFDYRINKLPASINPITANLIVGKIKNYLPSNVKAVADTFIGTGTMLAEFSMRYGKNYSYIGIDNSSSALNMAKENLKAIGVNAQLVLKDILKFSYNKGIDVIISNMPFGMRVGTHGYISELYAGFSIKLKEVLSDSGVAALLTADGKLLRQEIGKSGLKILKEFRVESGGLQLFLFIIHK